MKDIKFLIVGTAKSKISDSYYITERWRMWGVLFVTKKIESYWESLEEFNNRANQDFAMENNFQFFDLLTEIYPNDAQIDLTDHNTQLDIKHNTEKIQNSHAPNIIFNGKRAYLMYLLGLSLIDGREIKLTKLKKDVRDAHYGLQIDRFENRLAVMGKEKNIYLAPNTSSNANVFDEFVWIKILNEIK
jgi:hypothetical protein